MYQRRAFELTHPHGNWHGRGHVGMGTWAPRRASAAWFQRPYPYHLDYYRMRYGGSYAPYFGNLYGPPQVVTAPPYYGPYYGGYGSPVEGMYAAPLQLPGNGPPESQSQNNGSTLAAPQP